MVQLFLLHRKEPGGNRELSELTGSGNLALTRMSLMFLQRRWATRGRLDRCKKVFTSLPLVAHRRCKKYRGSWVVGHR